MSRKVNVQSEIRDMLILKDTLKQLGHNFTDVNADTVEIQRSYHPIRIDCKTGTIDFDSDHNKTVNEIKQTYTVNYYKDKAIREGNQIEEKVENGEIVLYVKNS